MRVLSFVRGIQLGVALFVASWTVTACSDSTAPAAAALSVWTAAPAGHPLAFSGSMILFATPLGGVVALDPATGSPRFQITPPSGVSSLLFERYETAGTLVELRAASTPWSQLTTSIAYDLRDGTVLATFRDQPGGQRVLGVVGGQVVRVLNDSVLVANAIGTNTESWRQTVPGLGCVPCGGMMAIDTVGGELLLLRLGLQTAALVRVTATGIASAVATSRETFRSAAPVQYGVRATPTAPVIVATDRALSAVDPVSGATRYRIEYSLVRPAGHYSFASRFTFTRDGRWLTALFVDSTGTAPDVSREYVLRTADGVRVRDRALTEATGLELFRGACGPTGLVRVLNDLRVERTDVSTGRQVLSEPVSALSALRTVQTSSGSIMPISTSIDSYLVAYYQLAQAPLVGMRCTL